MSEEKFQFNELIQEYLDKRIEQHKTSLELKQIIEEFTILKKISEIKKLKNLN